MSEENNFEQLTLKEAVQAHKQAELRKKQEEELLRQQMARRRMEEQGKRPVDGSKYTMQDVIARQIQDVMHPEEKKVSKPSSLAEDARELRERIERRNAETLGVKNKESAEMEEEKKPQTVQRQTSMQREKAVTQKAVPAASKVLKASKTAKVSNVPQSEFLEAMEEAEGTKLEAVVRFGEVGKWFQTLCWMNIPIFGFFYVLVMALRKKTPPEKKSFAIAFIIYKTLVFLLAVTLLYVLYKFSLDFIDGMMQYIPS